VVNVRCLQNQSLYAIRGTNLGFLYVAHEIAALIVVEKWYESPLLDDCGSLASMTASAIDLVVMSMPSFWA
jgi:hypothetical protein